MLKNKHILNLKPDITKLIYPSLESLKKKQKNLKHLIICIKFDNELWHFVSVQSPLQQDNAIITWSILKLVQPLELPAKIVVYHQ